MARADDDDDDRTEDDDEEGSRKGKPSSEDKQMAMIAHLGSIVVMIVAPLIIMIMYKDKSKFIDRHAKESLNFDITMLILTFATCGLGGIVAFPMLLIFHIIAGLKANEGKNYQYPMTIRFIK